MISRFHFSHQRGKSSLRIIAGCLAAVLMLLPGACRKEAPGQDGKPQLAVSYDAHKYILEQIAGEDYDINVLLPAGSDPEMYDPDMRTMEGLSKAGVYFTTGTLGFEERMLDILKANYPDLKIENVAEGVELIEGTHHHAGDSHNHSGDPHILSSIGNIRAVASNMLQGMKRLNPEDSVRFNKNFEIFSSRLDKIAAETDSLMKGRAGGSFVAMHPAMSYFARDYGVTQISLERDGKEASPRQLKERLEDAAGKHPAVLFYEKGHGEKGAREMARNLGIPVFALNLEAYDFLDNLRGAVKAYSEGAERNNR